MDSRIIFQIWMDSLGNDFAVNDSVEKSYWGMAVRCDPESSGGAGSSS
jgi:hypothetical protein